MVDVELTLTPLEAPRAIFPVPPLKVPHDEIVSEFTPPTEPATTMFVPVAETVEERKATVAVVSEPPTYMFEPSVPR